MTTTARFRVASFAALLLVSSLCRSASAQAGPPPDPNAQAYPPGQYPQQQQPYPQQQQPYPQQQQPYPQQGYPQQGYPQQQQPPGQYPQQGYPQQYPQQPPPSYPPPSYPQSYPPGGYPVPPPPPQGHRGLLLMGYLGLHGFLGATGEGLSPGLRIGGLLGFYASPVVSLNGELSIDILNFKSDTFAANASAARAVFSFSPLFHVPTGQVELVLGPKFGAWATAISFDGGASQSASGYLLGLNAGLFAHVGGRMSIGGLLSFEAAYPTNICQDDGFGNQICGDPVGSARDPDKVLAVTGALLF